MDCGYCVDCCWLNRRPNLKLETTASCFVSDKKTPRLRMSNTRPWCFYCRASPDLLFRVLNVYSVVNCFVSGKATSRLCMFIYTLSMSLLPSLALLAFFLFKYFMMECVQYCVSARKKY